MPDTGNKGGAYAHATYSTGTDVDGIAVADANSLTTDAIDNSVTTARLGYTVSVGAVEDNTGAIDGDVTVEIWGSDFDPDSEGFQTVDDSPYGVTFRPVQNKEIIANPIFVDGATYPKFEVYVYNDSGQELAITINLCPITIPVAS